MSKEVLINANSFIVWLIAALMIGLVMLQSALYIRHAMATAKRIDFPREKCLRALRVGAVSAIGPSIAVFIVMVGMMSVLGAPMTWLRLSIIGAAPTEITAAKLGAEASGREFGSPEYDMTALASSWWAMSVNGIGWLLLVGLFAHKLSRIREKVGGGDPKWLAVLSGAAMLGVFAYLNARSIYSGVDDFHNQKGVLVATLAGAVIMGIMVKIAQKQPALKEYALGIAMLAGMALAMAAQRIGG